MRDPTPLVIGHWSLVILALAAAPAYAVDHNNVDEGRPLRFDDASPLAFREQSLEAGLSLAIPRRRAVGLGLDAEYLYGIALNTQVNVGFHPSIAGEAASFGDVSLGALHSFRRETGCTPAMALRGDVTLPSGRGSHGVGYRLRGILSKSVRRYDHLHLNLDLNANPSAGRRQRALNPGLVLGWSKPLGLPRNFTTTGLAELAVQAGPREGSGPTVTLGIGVRRQVGLRSVVDLGLESDVAALGRAPQDYARLIAGYSYSF